MRVGRSKGTLGEDKRHSVKPVGGRRVREERSKPVDGTSRGVALEWHLVKSNRGAVTVKRAKKEKFGKRFKISQHLERDMFFSKTMTLFCVIHF